MHEQYAATLQTHQKRTGQAGIAVSAPGRVNLIGEHTDYTGGFVLPVAIDFRTVAVISPRTDGQITVASTNFEEVVQTAVAEVDRMPREHWSAYPLGVVWSLGKLGVHTKGFDLTLDGNVPLGAGLSSSASVEVATAMAVLTLTSKKLAGEQIAVACRRAENEFVGSSCGIMDQFVITNAEADRALLLDCRDLTFELPPLPPQTSLVVINSMVKHSVATGEYGNRSAEVLRGQAALADHTPGVTLLRDATLEQLEAARSIMDQTAYLRCRHIIGENLRVQQMREALAANDRERIGTLMAEAHRSMRDDFAASCPEVDTLVDLASRTPGCIGARITGGGFGGCTVNLVDATQAESFAATVTAAYQKTYGIAAQSFVCEAVSGAIHRAPETLEAQ